MYTLVLYITIGSSPTAPVALQSHSFFNLEKIADFVTRRVSEGYQVVSLAYASGYDLSPLTQSKKGKSPELLSPSALLRLDVWRRL